MTNGQACLRRPARLRVATIFAATGLVGPAIRILLWPPSQGGLAGSSFIYHLVILLWPTQILAPHDEEGIVTIGAGIVIGANFLLFATMGLLAALTISLLPLYLALAAIVFAGLSLWALFGAGFNLAYVHWGAFICACLVYATPFTLARRILARG